VALDRILLLRTTEDLTVREAKVVLAQVMAGGHPLLTIHLGACQMATRHQQVTGVHKQIYYIIIWQGKFERSDWFFLGWDFAIRTLSVERIISCVFLVLESRQIQNKHGPSAI